MGTLKLTIRYDHSAKLWQNRSKEGWGRDEKVKGGLRGSPSSSSDSK